MIDDLNRAELKSQATIVYLRDVRWRLLGLAAHRVYPLMREALSIDRLR
jgi:hypothetical protein